MYSLIEKAQVAPFLYVNCQFTTFFRDFSQNVSSINKFSSDFKGINPSITPGSQIRIRIKLI